MIEKILIVENKLGLHARPSALFVQTTNKFTSKVRVTKDGYEVDGKSIMGILTLAAEYGAQMKIVVDGPDEQELIDRLEELFKKKFDDE